MKKGSGRGSKPYHGKPDPDVRRDRKSGTGMSGSPKKGGHGGKFTWSGDGHSRTDLGFESGALDAKDPNFVDPEEAVGSANT